MDTGDADRGELLHLLVIPVELLRVRQLRHGGVDDRDCPPLAQLAGGHAVRIAHDLGVLAEGNRPRDASQVERLLGGEHRVEVHELEVGRAAADGLLDQITVDLAALKGVVEQAPADDPLVRPLALGLLADAGEDVVPRAGIEQVGADRIKRAHQRMHVRVGDARHERCTAEVDRARATTELTDLRVRTDGEDRAVAHGHGLGEGLGRIQRADLGVDDDGLDRRVHARVVARDDGRPASHVCCG